MTEARWHSRPPVAWTEEDDRFLLSFGWCLGVDFIAVHDLGRSPAEAHERLAWLRKNRSELVAELWVEAEGALS